jgi:hypothetical protein
MINSYTVRGGAVLLKDGGDIIIKADDGREVWVLYERGEFTFSLAHNRPADYEVRADPIEQRVIHANEYGWVMEQSAAR